MLSRQLEKVSLVGPRIRELRKNRNLTQIQLSGMIGVAQSDLSRMEQGQYRVGLDALFEVLQVFELTIADFFHETPEAASEELIGFLTDFRALSPEAQGEVGAFVSFKRAQEKENSSE